MYLHPTMEKNPDPTSKYKHRVMWISPLDNKPYKIKHFENKSDALLYFMWDAEILEI